MSDRLAFERFRYQLSGGDGIIGARAVLTRALDILEEPLHGGGPMTPTELLARLTVDIERAENAAVRQDPNRMFLAGVALGRELSRAIKKSHDGWPADRPLG